MNRVDFIAPPGAGKTTITTAIAENYYNIILQDEIEVDENTKKRFQNNEFIYFAKSLSDKQYKTNDQFSDSFINGMIMLELKSEVVKTINSESVVLFDESLSQRWLSLMLRSRRVRRHASVHYDLMSRPDLIIYIRADSETILSRIKHRDKVIALHRNKTEKEVLSMTNKSNRLCRKFVRKMQRENIQVLVLDGVKPIEDSVENIGKFLNASLPNAT